MSKIITNSLRLIQQVLNPTNSLWEQMNSLQTGKEWKVIYASPPILSHTEMCSNVQREKGELVIVHANTRCSYCTEIFNIFRVLWKLRYENAYIASLMALSTACGTSELYFFDLIHVQIYPQRNWLEACFCQNETDRPRISVIDL